MKICMFVRNGVTADPRVRREARALTGAGHTVVILGVQRGEGPPREVLDGATIIRQPGLGQRIARLRRRGAPSSGGAGGGGPRRAQRRLQIEAAEAHYLASAVAAGLAQRADAYHAHDLDTLAAAHACARLTGARLVYDSHELWVDWQGVKLGAPDWRLARWRRIERRGARAADLVITVSDALAVELAALYGISRPWVIRNCAPLRDPVDGAALRAAVGGDPARPLVLYQGGFSSGRGLLELVAAADHAPEADVVLMGHASPFRDEVQARAAAARHGNVYVLPKVSFEALWAFTCSADVGVVLTQPVCRSYAFSLSNKIFEYMVAGLPVLASDLVSHRAIAEETGAVTLADPDDPQALGAAIREMIGDRARLARMATAARAHAERRYNAEAEMGRLVQAYARLTPAG